MCDTEKIIDKLADCGSQAVKTAKEESVRLGHHFIGTEFLLLGLVGHRNTTSSVLSSFGLKLKRTREEVERIVGLGTGYTTEKYYFTPAAKNILMLSLEEAEKQGRKDITSAHLLLAIINQAKKEKGSASRVFEYLDVDIDALRSSLLEQL